MKKPVVRWRPCFGGDINEPSWRRRGYNVIMGLQKLGYDIKPTFDLGEPCDVFVLQRQASARDVHVLKTAGRIVVFDENDCHLFETFHNPEDAKVAALSDFVVTGSRWMQMRFSELNPRTFMIQEALEESFFTTESCPPSSSPIVLVWHGTDSNLPYIEWINPALERVARKVNILLKVIMPPKTMRGESNPDRIASYPYPTQFVPWQMETLVQEIASSHIGIAPLPDTEFCRNKGYHKAVGYMALGIPCVASRIITYEEVIEHGVSGMLASTQDEWYDSIMALAKSARLRARIARAGRKVAEYFRIRHVVSLWDKLLQGISAGTWTGSITSGTVLQ